MDIIEIESILTGSGLLEKLSFSIEEVEDLPEGYDKGIIYSQPYTIYTLLGGGGGHSVYTFFGKQGIPSGPYEVKVMTFDEGFKAFITLEGNPFALLDETRSTFRVNFYKRSFGDLVPLEKEGKDLYHDIEELTNMYSIYKYKLRIRKLVLKWAAFVSTLVLFWSIPLGLALLTIALMVYSKIYSSEFDFYVDAKEALDKEVTKRTGEIYTLVSAWFSKVEDKRRESLKEMIITQRNSVVPYAVLLNKLERAVQFYYHNRKNDIMLDYGLDSLKSDTLDYDADVLIAMRELGDG